ncbi:alpha-keto acid decarboxylase family protein [Waddlia chondrophila]|uniref:Pyruvate decarboxylase/indolepyruvate decarboxylase n=1 Tax=Waddlia chondrophila (strain ATCC VR-1470 / WSU 86-1044) TaxID=716544 RepID=D6YSD9_WADCW|nr:thiamine pyrophosphate-dependent enzyme [Waddlia chondrophila]ADI38984.1 Pyruvate decarboxylase/indolepyruvate decarboxylase [Waddlia chondrophila WSU 86-1044]
MSVTTEAKPSTATIGQYLLDRLHALGVEHIFGVPGDYILQFDKLIENHQINFINATRENTAGYMADAYARLRGLGVACITYGVGINITNAVAQGYVENSPFVVISGTASTEEFASCRYLHHMFGSHKGQLRDTTQMDIFQKMTVAQELLDNPLTAQTQIDRALDLCLTYKKPVYFEIPRNQVEQTIALAPAASVTRLDEDHEALAEVLEEVSEFLKRSERPVIWVGHEIQRHQLSGPILQFAEKYRIPIVSSILGKTTISEYHPLYMGIYQGVMSIEEVKEYVESADAIFVLGVALNEIETGMQTANLNAKQKVLASSERIKVNHHHYPRVSMHALVNGLASLDLNLRFRSDYPAYIDRRLPPFKAVNDKKTSVQRLFECLQGFLRAEHLIVCDFGDSLFGCSDLILEQDNFLSNPYFATLGFGIPAAIGAAQAVPQKRVVGVVGDGAFQMTCTELSTAVRYGLDPIIILLNNHGYATERPILEGTYNDILNWSYSKIPQILGGGKGHYARTEEEMEHAFQQAFQERGTFHLIEVELEQDDLSPALHRFSQAIKKSSS